jgi:predicted Zn-dependent protease with MMP-like domain
VLSFEEFQEKVRLAFEAIPPEFRERVEGPVVVRDARRHKDIRGMLTLGECIHSPDFAGGGELASTIVLYYGSFEELAHRDQSFDVEAEIVETVRHEVQHHVEDAVGAAKLRDLDWAEEENAKWVEGRDFAPNFWRAGEPWGNPEEGLRAVGRDLFLEVEARRDGLVLTVRGEELEIEPGEIEEEEEIFEWEGLGRDDDHHGHGKPAASGKPDGRAKRSSAPVRHRPRPEPGDLVVVLRKRKRILDFFRRRKP